MNTADCQSFLTTYFKNKNIKTDDIQWILQKKYKSFDGMTCRDFINSKYKNKLVVIADDNNNYSVIENADFEIFLEQKANHYIYFYAPFILDNQVVYYFVRSSEIDNHLIVGSQNTNESETLMVRLKNLFSNTQITVLSHMIVSFPNILPEEVMKGLNGSHFYFTEQIYGFLGKQYQKYYPECLLNMFYFADDMLINSQTAEDKLCKFCAQNKTFKLEDYARIKNLLKKINTTDLKLLKNVLESFRLNKDTYFNMLIKQEMYKRIIDKDSRNIPLEVN